MYTKIYSRVKHFTHHDSIEFPNDGIDFSVPKGYLTPEMVEMYRSLMIDVRNGVMW